MSVKTDKAKELLDTIKYHHAAIDAAEKELFAMLASTEAKADREPPLVSDVLEALNEQPERVFTAGLIIESLETPAPLASVVGALKKLHAEDFIKCIGRGRYKSHTNPEPKMGPEDEPQGEDEAA